MLIGILIFPTLAFIAAPDREARPDEWGYRPADGETVSVNPPSLTWIHASDAVRYTVQWARRPDFSDAVTVEGIRWCVYTHHEPLEPGTYLWRYRTAFKDGRLSDWSRVRRFTVPKEALIFPQPTMGEIRRRIPKGHPRLFLRPEDLPRLRTWAKGEGREIFEELIRQADRLLEAEPTPEPEVKATIRDPETRRFWWSNRVQSLKACREAETLAFAYLLTGDRRYGEAARRWVLHLASWDPDGPTNWRLNDEAAMPLLHRLPRAYDWAYEALSEEDREKVRRVMLRRATDAWNAGQIQRGIGHLNRPYNSHGNRAWHKLAECAIAFFGEIPEAEEWLDYAVNKFYAAYPVWSDDDGGWHEGLSYWAGYMSKIVWWTEVAERALSIDSFRKPFFAHVGDYALYTAPPGSPDMGFGDLSYRPPSSGWSFIRYFARKVQNGRWEWWAREWRIRLDPGEPVLRFLWSALPSVEPKPPTDLPPSKVFQGIGVAILNSTLLNSEENVQIRFKSSPFGRRSHGHDPHNSFTLNAYGERLLVNCVYRDWHGSQFHTRWCWSTKAHNVLLVDGEGQKPPSPDPLGRVILWDLQDGADYVAGDATAAYEGKLRRFIRHILFVKPDLIVVADEVETARPSTLQWMLHALAPFEVDEGRQVLILDRERVGLVVNYLASEPLRFRQWTGYDPEPDEEYMRATGRSEFPRQWHVEASTTAPKENAFVLTVLRPYRRGRQPEPTLQVEESETAILLQTMTGGNVKVILALRKPGADEANIRDLKFTCLALVRRGDQEWRLGK
jgi:hypothetical protein